MLFRSCAIVMLQLLSEIYIVVADTRDVHGLINPRDVQCDRGPI